MILIPAALRWCRRLGKKEDERTEARDAKKYISE